MQDILDPRSDYKDGAVNKVIDLMRWTFLGLYFLLEDLTIVCYSFHSHEEGKGKTLVLISFLNH